MIVCGERGDGWIWGYPGNPVRDTCLPRVTICASRACEEAKVGSIGNKPAFKYSCPLAVLPRNKTRCRFGSSTGLQHNETIAAVSKRILACSSRNTSRSHGTQRGLCCFYGKFWHISFLCMTNLKKFPWDSRRGMEFASVW